MDAFLLYIDDWLSSKKIELMDDHEERGYFRLLLRAAKEEGCRLPNDDARLAIMSGLGRQWFKPTAHIEKRIGGMTSGEKIRQCFVECDGYLINERLFSEYQHQQEVRGKRAEAGRAGANAKWGSKRDGNWIANGMANGMADASQMPSEIMANGIANGWQTGCQNDANPNLKPKNHTVGRQLPEPGTVPAPEPEPDRPIEPQALGRKPRDAIAAFFPSPPDDEIVSRIVQAARAADPTISDTEIAIWVYALVPDEPKHRPRSPAWFERVVGEFVVQRPQDVRLLRVFVSGEMPAVEAAGIIAGGKCDWRVRKALRVWMALAAEGGER